MYLGSYQYDNGTQPTTWYDYHSPTATRYYYTTPARWEPPPSPPKWWRWYDVFRTWEKPKLLRLLDGSRTKARRVQERYPIGQRRQQKRRAYVQALRAL